MASADAKAPGLVICSGHGLVTLAANGQLKPLKGKGAPVSRMDAPCVFAGHGLAMAPALSAVVAAPAVILPVGPAERAADLSPGRGLAAPPPPSQGPPSSIL
jgi:hypothetical protein